MGTLGPCKKLEPVKPRVKHFTPEIKRQCDNKDIQNPATGLCYGDLYVIGTIWIEAMKHVLVGSKFDVFPPVQAASPPEPKKPPPMKYKDLPLIATPHQDYKEHQERLQRCRQADSKLLHEPLYPAVRKTRKFIQKSTDTIKTGIADRYKDAKETLGDGVEKTRCYFRDPNSKQFRQGAVAAGGLTGFILARNKPLYQKLIFTSLGTLAGGFLAFPDETDLYFRSFLRESAKQIVCLYNCFNHDNLKITEKLRPCPKDLPQLKTGPASKCDRDNSDSE